MILDGNSKVGEAKVYATQKEMQLTKELETTKRQLEESLKLLNMAYNWGLWLYEGEEYQEMEDEDEKENMKSDLDMTCEFLNKLKNEKVYIWQTGSSFLKSKNKINRN